MTWHLCRGTHDLPPPDSGRWPAVCPCRRQRPCPAGCGMGLGKLQREKEVKCCSDPSLHCARAGAGARPAAMRRRVLLEAGVGSSSLVRPSSPMGAGAVPCVPRSSARSLHVWFKMRLPPASQQNRAELTRSSDNSALNESPRAALCELHVRQRRWHLVL